jgi:hypothetical protein
VVEKAVDLVMDRMQRERKEVGTGRTFKGTPI